MAIAALNPNVPRPPILLDTHEHCRTTLTDIQNAREQVYTALNAELGKNNPLQLDQIRGSFQTILTQLDNLKQDSRRTLDSMNVHALNRQTPELKQFGDEEQRLESVELKLREAAIKKGWFPISRNGDLRLDTPDDCLNSLEITQKQRHTIFSALESDLAMQGNLTPQKRSELHAVLTQAKELAGLAGQCLKHYSSRWPPTEQFKTRSAEEEKLTAWEKSIFQTASKHGFGAVFPPPLIPPAPLSLPRLIQSDLEVDTSENCLRSLKTVQDARLLLLNRLGFLIHQWNPDRFEIERLLQQAEQFRHLSHYCLERYRWSPETSTHNTVDHHTHCHEEARLTQLESTVRETATGKGWIGQVASSTPIDLPSTDKIIRFCKAHPLIPVGIAGSVAGFAGWIPMENPIGCFAPALAGFLTSVAVDPKQTFLDTIGMSDFLLKNLARRALPIATWAIGTACMYDAENLSRAPYLLGTAALLQMGADYELWKSSLSVQCLATSAIDSVKWWFKNGYRTGPIAAAAAGAISYSFDQSFPTIGLFGLGLYGVHAGFAFLHANRGGAP